MNVKELLHEYDSLLSRAHWGVGTKRHEVSYSEWATIFLGNNNAPLVGTSRPDDTDMFTSPRPITFEYDEDGPRQILDLMRQSMTGEIVDPELCAHRHFVKSWLDDTIFAHEVHDLQPFIYHGLMRTCNRLTKRNLPYFNTCNSPADAHAEFKYLECHNFKPGRLMKITAYRQFYQTIKRMYPDPVRRDSSLPARSSDPSKRRRIDDMQPDSSDLDLSAAAEPGPQADEYSEVPDQTDGLASMPATNTPSLPRNVATGRSFVGMVIAAGKDDAKSSACRSGSGTPCIGTAGTYKKLGQGDMLHGGWLDVAIARRGSSEIIWGGELKLATTLSLEHLIGLQSVVESEGGLQMIATGWTVGDDPSTLPKALDLRVEFTAQQCSNEQPLSVSVMPVLCQIYQEMVMNRCPRVFLYTYDAMMLFYLSAGGTIKVSPVISLDREWRSASLPCSPMDMLVALQLHTRVLFDAKSTGAEGITVPWGEVMEEYFDKVVGEVSGVLSHTAKLATDEESSRPIMQPGQGKLRNVRGLSTANGRKIHTMRTVIAETADSTVSPSSVIELGEVIGHGRMGRVFTASISDNPSAALVAKVVEMTDDDEYDSVQKYRAALNEARLYATNLLPLQGKWVPYFYGLFTSGSGQFVEGDTWLMLLSKAGDFPLGGSFEEPSRAVFDKRGMIMTLYYQLHQADVVHHDLAPRHIFYTNGASNVVAIDFESSEDISGYDSRARVARLDEEAAQIQSMLYISS